MNINLLILKCLVEAQGSAETFSEDRGAGTILVLSLKLTSAGGHHLCTHSSLLALQGLPHTAHTPTALLQLIDLPQTWTPQWPH